MQLVNRWAWTRPGPRSHIRFRFYFFFFFFFFFFKALVLLWALPTLHLISSVLKSSLKNKKERTLSTQLSQKKKKEKKKSGDNWTSHPLGSYSTPLGCGSSSSPRQKLIKAVSILLLSLRIIFIIIFAEMKNWLSKFFQISFQSSNFVFIHFSPLTFKFIQLRLFHQFLLYVVVNFSIL